MEEPLYTAPIVKCVQCVPQYLYTKAISHWAGIDESHPDVQWFRRCRQCLSCSHIFVTGEFSEQLIDELLELRKLLAIKNSKIVRRILREVQWLKKDEDIPKELASEFIEKSTWWLDHPSGGDVRSPRHSSNVKLSDRHGWVVDFGANTFLVGIALRRCRAILIEKFTLAESGRFLDAEQLREKLAVAISGAVANKAGNEYAGYYPITNGDLLISAEVANNSPPAENRLE